MPGELGQVLPSPLTVHYSGLPGSPFLLSEPYLLSVRGWILSDSVLAVQKKVESRWGVSLSAAGDDDDRIFRSAGRV